MSELDRRAFTRLVARLDAALEWAARTPLPAQLDDLSLGGAFVRIERGPAPDTSCRLFLRLRNGGGKPLVLRASVVHARGDGVGLRFDEVSLEAFEHLHDLLLELGGDPARMEEELERSWVQGFEAPAP